MDTYQGGWSSPPPVPRDSNSGKLSLMVAAGLLLALVVTIGTGVAVRSVRSNVVGGVATAAGSDGQTPAGVAANGAIRIGEPAAKVVVRVVADLQCPACRSFDRANGKVLEDAVKSGTAVVEYNVISFLDRASTDKYSSRAGNASYCVARFDPSKYQGWLATMFDKQPKEGGAGLSDGKLIEIAKQAGYTDAAVATCITDRKYDAYLRQKTTEVLDSGVNSTPSVFVNGVQVTDPGQLMTRGGLGPVIAAAR
ncbi:thioredoxin domain-containing protein [Nocardia sp. NPDC049220]|uniref:DsbA family protein n=1 Tax=Nocardia sp. NPDC049220 TaxID=3155273 RepID=UPI0033DC8923